MHFLNRNFRPTDSRTWCIASRYGVAALATIILLLCACETPTSHQALFIPGPGFTVLAAGDIADCRQRQARDSGAADTAALVQRELTRHPEAYVLTLGDHTYPAGLPQEFSDCYHPTWGRFKARTLPTPGNHEYYTAGAPGYFGYFPEHAGPAGLGYYKTFIGGWRVIAINSALRNEQFDAQLRWLQQELRRDSAACTLAFWHHPAFSSGGHAPAAFMRPVWRELQAAGADVVLSGHDHDYERFAQQDASGRKSASGIRQFVVGTGGAYLTPMRAIRPNSEAQANSAHGVLKLSLKATGYEWDYLSVDNKAYADRGASFCHHGEPEG